MNSAAPAENPRLAAALHLAGLGFPTFPLYPPGEGDPKQPRIKGWQDKATTDAVQLRAWWQQWPDCNPGILTTGYVVLDVDAKPERNGYRTLEDMGVDPFQLAGATYTQHTPSGGLHLFYRAPWPVRNVVDWIKKDSGLDVRGRGGLVVGAGAQFPAGEYNGNDLPVAECPPWLVDKLQQAPEKSGTPAEILPGVDPQRAEQRGTEYLSSLPAATLGGRNVACRDAAYRLGDLGVSVDEAVGLMVEHFPAEPGLDFDEIEKTVRSAYEGRESPVGWGAPEVQFSPIDHGPAANDDGAPATDRKPRLYFETFGSIELGAQPPALVSGLLDAGAMSVVYGESNSGKTYWTMDLALHVALGRPWNDRSVEPGAVVYIAAEGGGSLRKRVIAFRQYHRLEGEAVPFALVPCAVDLLNPHGDTAELVALVRNAADALAQPVRLVVVDTLSRALAGGNENSPDAMGAFIRNVDAIRAASGAHCLIVHHSGKDKAAGARGHSSLRAATDTELEVEPGQVWIKKQRDFEPGPPLRFGLVPVEIGRNDRDEPVTACVVRGMGAAEHFTRRPESRAECEALDALREIIDESGEIGGVPEKIWREKSLGRLTSNPENMDSERRAFSRVKNSLSKSGFVILENNRARVPLFAVVNDNE